IAPRSIVRTDCEGRARSGEARRGRAPLFLAIRQGAFRQVVELGERALEQQRHRADRAVTLLADDHFRDVVHLGRALLPLVEAVVEFFVPPFPPLRLLPAFPLPPLPLNHHVHPPPPP